MKDLDFSLPMHFGPIGRTHYTDLREQTASEIHVRVHFPGLNEQKKRQQIQKWLNSKSAIFPSSAKSSKATTPNDEEMKTTHYPIPRQLNPGGKDTHPPILLTPVVSGHVSPLEDALPARQVLGQLILHLEDLVPRPRIISAGERKC